MKFTIRDIILLTVAVAICGGWWADRRQWQIQHQEMLNEMVRQSNEDVEISTESLRQKIYDSRERQSKWRKEWTEMWAKKGHNVYLPPEEQSALYTPGAKAIAPPKAPPEE